MQNINLNFLLFKNQNQEIEIFRKLASDQSDPECYYHSFKDEQNEKYIQYEVKFQPTDGFEKYNLLPYQSTNIIAKSIYERLKNSLPNDVFFIKNKENKFNKKIHFVVGEHPKGKKCIWIEPYFLKSKGVWGFLFDYTFVVDETNLGTKFNLDKDILIASGSLNEKGTSNFDFYMFKHNHLNNFIKTFKPIITQALNEDFEETLYTLQSSKLNSKIYLFGNGSESTSSYLGLTKNPPLKNVSGDILFYFIYKQENRDIAVSLLRGLRGETNPTTFAGMERLFKLAFDNSKIKGISIAEFSDKIIDEEITKLKAQNTNLLPIIITNSKKAEEDDKLYFWLKHKFTNAGLPCQVVTKDLIKNDYTLKYSLSNIGLQIFAKSGGQPWKMKSTNNEYLIVGIGQSYNHELTSEGNKIEKNITYSVLTDSSGLFKDIQVLGEGVEDDNYYEQLITNLSNIINYSNYKKVSIHCPFRMSKEKILAKVIKKISPDVELSVLVINSKSDFFGFDYSNNGLVPFESSYIKIASDEFLVWFEGLQTNNPKITKRFGNPLLIKFWYSSNQALFEDYKYKERLLQDCINLSGANWRGFKAKQLPVSVFYCQRIAEFIGKFKQYELEHIEISNLKPWFL